MFKKLGVAVLSICLCLSFSGISFAKAEKKAIVLASFGTSYPSALQALINIEKVVKKENPGVVVKHAFTSNIIRKIWQERQDDKKFQKENPGIPEDFMYVKTPLSTIADLQNQGFKNIVVQSTHVFAGEEYADLNAYVNGLNSIKTMKEKFMPFEKLVVGRPALGHPGTLHDYHEDMEAAAKTLAGDVAAAKKKGAALVYMGHGNEYFSTGAYVEFQSLMRKMYPGVSIFVGTVEGYPSIDDVVSGLKHTNTRKVLLKPFMVVAGDHASNDMAGDEDDSWKVIFTKMGIKVTCDVTGLGENDGWASIYARNIKEVMEENGL